MNVPDNAARNAEIVRRRRAGEMPADISRDMGLSRNVVAGVLDRAGLTDPKTDKQASHAKYMPRGQDRSSALLDDEAVRVIRREYRPREPGRCLHDFAERFGVSDYAVWAVVNEITWRHVA